MGGGAYSFFISNQVKVKYGNLNQGTVLPVLGSTVKWVIPENIHTVYHRQLFGIL